MNAVVNAPGVNASMYVYVHASANVKMSVNVSVSANMGESATRRLVLLRTRVRGDTRPKRASLHS